MSVTLDIRSDFKAAQDQMATHQRAVMTAAVRAMNRTATTVRKDSADELKESYPGLKVSSLKGRMRLTRATRNNPQVTIKYRGSRISMMGNFNMRRRGRFGVAFSKLPWRLETVEGEIIPPGLLQTNAFINKLQRGQRETVLVRIGDRRLPISVLLATGIAKAVTEKGVLGHMEKSGRATFNKNFASELAYAKSRSE